MAARTASALRERKAHVEKKFIAGSELDGAREAALALVTQHGQVAEVGNLVETGRVDTRYRASNVVDLLDPSIALPEALAPLLRAVDELRIELSRATGRA